MEGGSVHTKTEKFLLHPHNHHLAVKNKEAPFKLILLNCWFKSENCIHRKCLWILLGIALAGLQRAQHTIVRAAAKASMSSDPKRGWDDLWFHSQDNFSMQWKSDMPPLKTQEWERQGTHSLRKPLAGLPWNICLQCSWASIMQHPKGKLQSTCQREQNSAHAFASASHNTEDLH